MGPETTHVIFGFGSDTIQEFLIAGIHAASKHKLLPHEYSHLVAHVVEIIGLVNAPAPHAQHVHVCINSRLQQPAIFLFAYSSWKAVSRNPVCTFCKNGDAVNNERETLSPRVVLMAHLE